MVEERLDVRAGLGLPPETRRELWAGWLDEAESRPSVSFHRSGFTVTALQADWASIHAARHLDRPDQVEAALQTVIAIYHDTDTQTRSWRSRPR